jgi:hypothetical protein
LTVEKRVEKVEIHDTNSSSENLQLELILSPNWSADKQSTPHPNAPQHPRLGLRFISDITAKRGAIGTSMCVKNLSNDESVGHGASDTF